jgi:DNA-binding response OmpR family regulator
MPASSVVGVGSEQVTVSLSFERSAVERLPGWGRSAMLVEDEALIAFGLEEALQDQGFAVTGPFYTCADALASLERATPAVAILDALLRDGTCLELARELCRKGVPFLIYSGRDAFEEHPPELEGVPWVEKPTAAEGVVASALRLLSSARQPGAA